MIEKFTSALQAACQKHATNALQTPSSKDVFEYGRAVGMYAGLQQARDIILKVYADENKEN